MMQMNKDLGAKACVWWTNCVKLEQLADLIILLMMR